MKSATWIVIIGALGGAACETNKAPPNAQPAGTSGASSNTNWSTTDVGAPKQGDLDFYSKAISGSGELLAAISTPQGTIHCKFLPDNAPLTVANFVGLATGQKAWKDPSSGKVMTNKPYFEGLIFHRVIPGFMIQGGDPTGTGQAGPGYEFVNEGSPQVTMQPGTLAMANAGPNTNGSQFFITEGAPAALNGGYTIFGRCKETEIVKAIEALGNPGNSDRPNTDVPMKVTISKGTY